MDTENEQLALLAKAIRKVKSKPAPAISAVDPIARVLVDVSLPHLDRYFDYLVPERFGNVEVGTIVRVPLNGRRVDAWVVDLIGSRTDDQSYELKEILDVASSFVK